MVAEGTVALDEMINKPQGPELTGSSGELGFYSKALEETKKLQQKKGTGNSLGRCSRNPKCLMMKNGLVLK